MRRFFIDEKSIENNMAVIKGQEAHHIRDVIRLKEGDRFIGLDGKGKVYTLRVLKTGQDITALIEKVSLFHPKIPRILLACAIPKKGKMDDIIEKSTELGVSDIIPIITERTIVKADYGSAVHKKSRWQKIAIEASKQSGRSTFANVHDIMHFKVALEIANNMGYDKKIIPCVAEGTKKINDMLSKRIESIAAFIGPEGDFTHKEVEIAESCGFQPVSLGPLVLKVDTACYFTLSVIAAKFL
jgi:16S rRNA (uracil1498-N3)-methyltransferase